MDAWSSRIYQGYMAVTAHWIEDNWLMKTIKLDLKRFPTPRTAGHTSKFLRSIIADWKISGELKCITTDNAADICKGVKILFQKPNDDYTDKYKTLDSFHVRCVAQIINNDAKEYIETIENEFCKVRSVITSLEESVKLRDLFGEVKNELKINCELPSVDCQTRWSSTFEILKGALQYRRFINTTMRRIGVPTEYILTEEEWQKTKRIFYLLESAALNTESQCGSIYMTLSINSKLFQRMKDKFQKVIEDKGTIILQKNIIIIKANCREDVL